MTDLRKLQKLVKRFIDERDWRRFQTTKELAMNASVEANELLELFLWQNERALDKKILNKEDTVFLKKIKNETADVFLACLSIADQAGFDLEEAFVSKMKELDKRYDKKKVYGDPRKIPSKE
jgi:NTP pyrophosphatase (non-canonical NTP hydrolase)